MRKKLLIFIISLFVIFIFALSEAFALELSADMITKSGNNTYSGKLYIKGDKIRTDMAGQSEYTILRQDKNVVWLVKPEKKAYLEMPFDPKQKPKIEEKIKGEASRKFIGIETINGYPTKKYEVVVKEDGRTKKFYQWIAEDIGFPIKTATINGSWAVEYRNLKKSVSDSLFEIPAGYSKMTIPGMLEKGGMKQH